MLGPLLLAAGVTGAACAARAPQVAAERPVQTVASQIVELGAGKPYFVAGETITWRVSFHGLEGGRARFAVGRPAIVDGRHVVAVVAEAESAGLASMAKLANDNLTSWVDVDSGLPVRTEAESNVEGGEVVVKTARPLGKAVAEVTSTRAGKESKTSPRLPVVGTHDSVSAILALRAWRPKDGEHARFYSLGGTRVWRADLVVEAHERIDGPMGTRRAIRMRGSATRLDGAFRDDKSKKPRRFVVWFSDDDDRIPLRIEADTEYGSIDVDATSYERSPG